MDVKLRAYRLRIQNHPGFPLFVSPNVIPCSWLGLKHQLTNFWASRSLIPPPFPIQWLLIQNNAINENSISNWDLEVLICHYWIAALCVSYTVSALWNVVCVCPSGCAGAGGEAADGCQGEGESGRPAAGTTVWGESLISQLPTDPLLSVTHNSSNEIHYYQLPTIP